MLSNRALALAVGLAIPPQIVDAAEGAARCVDASVPKHAAEARDSKWIELTSEQWRFFLGTYAMDPLAPSGHGDKGALVKIGGSSGGMGFFIDGVKGWMSMAIPDWRAWSPSPAVTIVRQDAPQ